MIPLHLGPGMFKSAGQIGCQMKSTRYYGNLTVQVDDFRSVPEDAGQQKPAIIFVVPA